MPKPPRVGQRRVSTVAANAAAKRIYDDDGTASHFTATSTQLPHSTDNSLGQDTALVVDQTTHENTTSNNNVRNPLFNHRSSSPLKNNNNNAAAARNNKISFGPTVEALENSKGPTHTYNKDNKGALGSLTKKSLKQNSKAEMFHPDPLLASTKIGADGGNNNNNDDNDSNERIGGGDNQDDINENENENRGGGGGRVGFAETVETVESSIGSGSQSDNSGSEDSMGDGGASSGTGSSSSSMSSNARRSREIANRPMVLYMTLLIGIPVLFLAVYQIMSVAEAQATLNFMNDHEPPVIHMLELQTTLHKEMEVGSELIGLRTAYGVNGETAFEDLPSWTPQQVKDDIKKVEKYSLETRTALSKLILEVSDGSGAIPEFHPLALTLPEVLARAEIAANRNDGPLFRSYLSRVMDDLTVMLAILQADDRAQLFQIEFTDLNLLTRAEEELVFLFSMYTELEHANNFSSAALNSPNASQDFEQNCITFAQRNSKLNGFTKFLTVGSGNKEIINSMKYFREVGFPPLRQSYDPFINCQFGDGTAKNNVTWGDPTAKLATVNDLISRITSVQRSVFNKIVDNKDVQNRSVAEGMKLFAALVCCIIGVVVVIQIQRKEKKELLQIINHSERLAHAVRRFVPKNQLRMMGVRTVLQIEPGYSTEIANALIHSDIRSFTSLSEKMTRTELFDWLQMYVSRMTYVVRSCRGFIDSLKGDGLVSVFPGSAVDGVNAAIMMQQETDHMNVDLVAMKESSLVRIGIGVHFGVVVAGVFGDDSRLTCTMVAPDVNLCARLEEMTKAYGTRIILSRAVVDQIDPEQFELRTLGPIEATSVQQDLEIFDLYQSDPSELKQFKNQTKDDFERAIHLMNQDGNIDAKREARSLFLALRQEAAERQLVDCPLELKLTELECGVKNTMKSLETIVSQHENSALNVSGTGSMGGNGSTVNEYLLEVMKTPMMMSLGGGEKRTSGSVERAQ